MANREQSYHTDPLGSGGHTDGQCWLLQLLPPLLSDLQGLQPRPRDWSQERLHCWKKNNQIRLSVPLTPHSRQQRLPSPPPWGVLVAVPQGCCCPLSIWDSDRAPVRPTDACNKEGLLGVHQLTNPEKSEGTFKKRWVYVMVKGFKWGKKSIKTPVLGPHTLKYKTRSNEKNPRLGIKKPEALNSGSSSVCVPLNTSLNIWFSADLVAQFHLNGLKSENRRFRKMDGNPQES